MRILWASAAPWVGSGYGQQTALFVPRLAALGHQVAIGAHYGIQGSALEWAAPDGTVYPVYPSITNEWDKHKLWLPMFAAHWGGGREQGCHVITLTDVWAISHRKMGRLNLSSWTPVDHDPLPPRVAQFFMVTGAKPIAMSRFGQARLQDAGFDAQYVPHGVDTNIFQPTEDRDEVRKEMGLPEDAFLVGMVAANIGDSPPRKAFPQVFQAFAELRRRHSDAFLYLHTDMLGLERGLNLPVCADICGVPEESYSHSDQMQLQTGVPAEEMARIYSAFDVLVNPSYGEGFGIPIVEAQACGTPVIVTNWTSMPELCGAGWTIGGERLYDPHHNSFYLSPSVGQLVEALEEAYDTARDEQLRTKARVFALDYDADTITSEHWAPVLEAMDTEAELPLLREVVAG